MAKIKSIATRACAACVATAGLATAFPTYAWAEEEAGGISVLIPNMNEFLPMLVAFILVAIVLAKFGWPVVDNIIVKRENTIKKALEESEKAKQESEELLQEYKKQLADAKAQAAQIVKEANETAEALKADIQAKAQAEATDMIAKAKSAIEVEKKSAIAELQASIADTSINVASRLIGNDLSETEHRAIIERYVAEAGSFNAN